MSYIKRAIKLTQAERKVLREFTSKGEHPVMLVRRAFIILASDTSYGRIAETEISIASKFGITKQTVHNVKCDYLLLGVENFLQRRKRKVLPVPARIDGNFEAHLIALCCNDPPEGYSRWSVRLLADKVVELGYIDSISHMTVSRVLKKTNLNLT